MRIDDYDYELPGELIAQAPLPDRDASRLMLLEREHGGLEHRRFAELPRLLDPGDLLVLNDTRVLPARLLGRKPGGGGIEVFLLERDAATAGEAWECLLRASRKPPRGSRIRFEEQLTAEVLERRDDRWLMRFEHPAGDPAAALRRIGRMPLPPYIHRRPDDARDAEDRLRYQTVFGRAPGAVAAPTAGLHFTERSFAALRERGVRLGFLTLHVGLGTFLPVRVERVEDHVMHEERFVLPAATAEALAETRRGGGRVVAVGTTVVRTLEHQARPDGTVEPGAGRSGLYIRPGHRFRVVDALLTNFHLPRSTLLLLVSAFAGREAVLAAYREAVRERYRFYSYGDAMLIR